MYVKRMDMNILLYIFHVCSVCLRVTEEDRHPMDFIYGREHINVINLKVCIFVIYDFLDEYNIKIVLIL